MENRTPKYAFSSRDSFRTCSLHDIYPPCWTPPGPSCYPGMKSPMYQTTITASNRERRWTACVKATCLNVPLPCTKLISYTSTRFKRLQRSDNMRSVSSMWITGVAVRWYSLYRVCRDEYHTFLKRLGGLLSAAGNKSYSSRRNVQCSLPIVVCFAASRHYVP